MDADPAGLVASFLRAAREGGVAALVVYGVGGPEGPVLRIQSNSDPKGTRGILDWIGRTDEQAVETSARVLHEDGQGEGRGPCRLCGVDGAWRALDDAAREAHVAATRVVLRAAAATTKGRVLADSGAASSLVSA